MAKPKISNVEHKCLVCGSTKIVGPDDMTDNSPVVCGDCGADLGTYGEVKAKLLASARDSALQTVKLVTGKGWRKDKPH